MHLTAGNIVVFAVARTWLSPLWEVAAGAAAAGMLLYGLFLALRLLAPRVAAIMHTTAKEGMSQPLFFVLLALGIFALVAFPFIPYNTLGEDVKMLKGVGLELIKVISIVLALWTASISIAEEIEGRTALTLLSKPVGRRELIFGKFLGVLLPVAVLFIVLGAVFLGSVSYKVVYDARETSNPEPTAKECLDEITQISPGLALAFMEVVVLASISVAVSTRLPWLPNLVICSSIYVLGHLMPMLTDSAVGKFEPVRFVAWFLSAVIPLLDHFSMEAAISAGVEVPPYYLAISGLYALVFTAVAMLLALLLFEDRDLA